MLSRMLSSRRGVRPGAIKLSATCTDGAMCIEVSCPAGGISHDGVGACATESARKRALAARAGNHPRRDLNRPGKTFGSGGQGHDGVIAKRDEELREHRKAAAGSAVRRRRMRMVLPEPGRPSISRLWAWTTCPGRAAHGLRVITRRPRRNVRTETSTSTLTASMPRARRSAVWPICCLLTFAPRHSHVARALCGLSAARASPRQLRPFTGM